MSKPAVTNPRLFRGAAGTSKLAARPIRPGWRPFTEKTRGKRPAWLKYATNSSNATPNFGSVGVYGCDLPYPTEGFGVNASGQLVPGGNVQYSANGAPLYTGGVVETQTLTGGVGTGISMITVVYGGKDVTAAPNVVFTGGGGSSAAATAVIRDRRVVGIQVTNAGSGYTSAPVITFTGGGEMTTAPIATCGIGQVTTINTHILYNAHAPITAMGAYPTQGFYWFLEVLGAGGDRIVPCSTSLFSATADDGALDEDQHINDQFTVATGTHPDGTLTIGVLTLTTGLPNNTRVRVYSCPVREVSTYTTHNFDQTQVPVLDLMWAIVGAAGDNTNREIWLEPAVGG